MIIQTTTHPLAGILMLLVWGMDMYLVLAGVRLLLSGVNADWARRVVGKLQPFTDSLLHAVRNAMVSRGTRPPLWVSYLVVLLAGAVLRQTVLWTALHFH